MKHNTFIVVQLFLALVLLAAILTFSCKKQPFQGRRAVAVLAGTKEDTVVQGTLTFTEQKDGAVKLELDVTVPGTAGENFPCPGLLPCLFSCR